MKPNPPKGQPAWLVTYTYRTAQGSGQQHITVYADTASQARTRAWLKAKSPQAARHRRMGSISVLQSRTAPVQRIPESER